MIGETKRLSPLSKLVYRTVLVEDDRATGADPLGCQAAPLTATFHIPTRPASCSPHSPHEPWSSARRQGRIRYFGRQGRAKSPRNSWYWYRLILFCHPLGCLSPSPALITTVAVSPLSIAIAITIPPPSVIPCLNTTRTRHHDNQIRGLHVVPQHLQLAGGMCVAAWRVLGGVNTAGSAETAAMLLTGGFVEMAWTGVDGVPPCRRPPCRVPQ